MKVYIAVNADEQHIINWVATSIEERDELLRSTPSFYGEKQEINYVEDEDIWVVQWLDENDGVVEYAEFVIKEIETGMFNQDEEINTKG